MFTPRDHVVVCHGCGSFHIIRTAFLGSALSLSFNQQDGDTRRVWVVPAHACPTCHAIKTDKREDHPIARAFNHGMTPEARALANTQFTEWLPRLEQQRSDRERGY